METKGNAQLSAATALVQLLTEHPVLSDHVSWSIPRTYPSLTGYIHDGGMGVLADCAKALGGSIRAGREYESGGERLRQHTLSSVWRDVRVEVTLTLPVAVAAVAA